MNKLAIVLLLVGAATGACRRQAEVGSPPETATPGAATPREAVHRFMAAAKAQDLDAMSVAWGSAAGPARSTMDRATWEQREVVLMQCLKHDSYRILGEAPAAGGERVILVELKFKDLTRSTNFYATVGPEQRWYVRSMDVDALQQICTRKP